MWCLKYPDRRTRFLLAEIYKPTWTKIGLRPIFVLRWNKICCTIIWQVRVLGWLKNFTTIWQNWEIRKIWKMKLSRLHFLFVLRSHFVRGADCSRILDEFCFFSSSVLLQPGALKNLGASVSRILGLDDLLLFLCTYIFTRNFVNFHTLRLFRT